MTDGPGKDGTGAGPGPAATDGRRRAARPPVRRSLIVRLLAVSALVAACSVAASVWIAVQTTSGAIKKQQGRILADDTLLLDTLTGYAATHTSWDGVSPVVRDLARRTGRRIALVTQDGVSLADTAPHSGGLPGRAWAVVDPLAVNGADPIDRRATGPFKLTGAERRTMDGYALQQVECLRGQGVEATVVHAPSGRPTIRTFTGSGDQRAKGCDSARLGRPTATERAALRRLDPLVADCLANTGLSAVRVQPDFSWRLGAGVSAPLREGAERQIPPCITEGRKTLLKSYVAPSARLFVDSGESVSQGFRLSGANIARVAGAAGLVFALALGVTALAAVRLVRPLHALTDAAQRMRDGDGTALVPVTTDDEIGRLTETFNDMTAHRARLEEQRRAMVGDVAHELRTPLSNIRGWLEAAQDRHVPADQEFLTSLHEEAVLLQHVIDDLQDLAAADAGALHLHRERVEVGELVGQVGAAYRARAETTGVRVTTKAPPDHWIDGDPVRLRQAVGNLVSNAVRHTPAGGSVELRVTATGDATLIEVADTGTGIAAEDLPRVFDRFWRAEKSRSRRTGGSGLGLAIARKLVEAHGGSVAVRSEVDAGTVFTLRLPT
ncbi:cell wall metabolism sensor histidine kinase WalK [Streptomyces sp. NBC_00878]|uniref:sensor histidine kinase n=1 Tax=Streptomyces sp. NBC_00878 TaxID=2975854 RepID=UPI002256E84E|nr:HAMP domain-containing sensor histidine kinase [Streptomyces sp. NBC_00878]MCX4911183.1 HAMP domain-containing histidine kinase [Streptomyces sp. NBC_00878]